MTKHPALAIGAIALLILIVYLAFELLRSWFDDFLDRRRRRQDTTAATNEPASRTRPAVTMADAKRLIRQQHMELREAAKEIERRDKLIDEIRAANRQFAELADSDKQVREELTRIAQGLLISLRRFERDATYDSAVQQLDEQLDELVAVTGI